MPCSPWAMSKHFGKNRPVTREDSPFIARHRSQINDAEKSRIFVFSSFGPQYPPSKTGSYENAISLRCTLHFPRATSFPTMPLTHITFFSLPPEFYMNRPPLLNPARGCPIPPMNGSIPPFVNPSCPLIPIRDPCPLGALTSKPAFKISIRSIRKCAVRS